MFAELTAALPLKSKFAQKTDTRIHAYGCKMPGCIRARPTHHDSGGDKGGKGYCGAHYRNLLRFGHPEGAKVKSDEDLQDAAHRYGDDDTVEREMELATAAAKWAAVRGAGRIGKAGLRQEERDARVLAAQHDIISVEFFEVRDAALAYTNHDAEAPLASFEAAKKRLETAAARFFRSLGATEMP